MRKLITMAMLAASVFVFTGCGDKSEEEKIEEAAEDVQKGMEGAAEEMKEGAEKMKEGAEEAAKGAGKALDKAMGN